MTVHGADSCWTTKEIDSLAALLLTQLAAVHAQPKDAQDDAEPSVSVQRRHGIPGPECTAKGRVVQSRFTGGVSFQQVVNELENETLLKTAAGTFDFQPQHFRADAAAQGFVKKASDHSFYIFDSFKQFDGRLYVALNSFSGKQNALALLHDDLSTCEVIGHFNTMKSIIIRLFPTRRVRSFVSPGHLGRKKGTGVICAKHRKVTVWFPDHGTGPEGRWWVPGGGREVAARPRNRTKGGRTPDVAEWRAT